MQPYLCVGRQSSGRFQSGKKQYLQKLVNTPMLRINQKKKITMNAGCISL